MNRIDEFRINNDPNDINIIIDSELLYSVIFRIFGMDDEDPWYYDYKYMKKLCSLYGFPNNYEYIKNKIEKIMKRIIDENLDYDLGLP